MHTVLENFKLLAEINEKNRRSTQEIEAQCLAMEGQRVTIPVVGKFSSGKSALINTLLNIRTHLLRESILPETAVPTELVYSEYHERCLMETSQGTKEYSLEEYSDSDFDFSQAKSVTIELTNDFLKDIQDVMLVDMPGFDSGYEMHNQAIDHYLPRSLAYIFTFSAEEMSLRATTLRTLKEIIAYDMPVCITITKCDKVSHEILESNLIKLKADLQKHLGKSDFIFCTTSSLGDVSAVKHFLASMQAKSQSIIGKKYKQVVLRLAQDIHIYLSTMLEKQSFTVSELNEKEDALNRELVGIKKTLAEEARALECIVPTCVASINSDIIRGLEAEMDTFVAMAMNQQDISAQLNSAIRIALAKGIQKNYVPKAEKHIEGIVQRMQSLVSADAGLLKGKFSKATEKIEKNVVSNFLISIALVFEKSSESLFDLFLAWFASAKKKEKEAKKQREAVVEKLQGEIFPKVLLQIGDQLETQLMQSTKEINAAIADELNGQYVTVANALNQIIMQKSDENALQECIIEGLFFDMAAVKEIIDECQQ